MRESPRGLVPLWLKVLYTAWMAVWVPVYWWYRGPANFLWLCDVANFVVWAAIWRESRLLFSSQAVGVLIVQTAWAVDVAGRLISGSHPIGGTEYMFDPAVPLAIRALSLFHLAMPLLLLWAVQRLGYDPRGWRLQTAIAWLVLPISFLADPVRNLNWLWAPFERPQTLLPPVLFLIVCMLLYPLLLYLPTHALLAWWQKSRPPSPH